MAALGSRAVTDLRAGPARFPEDGPLRRLVGELTAGSLRSADLWAAPPAVVPMGADRELVDHPDVGRPRRTAAPPVAGRALRVAVSTAHPAPGDADRLELLGAIGTETFDRADRPA